MDDEHLVATIHQMKLEDPTITIKQVHAALTKSGQPVSLPDVKKSCRRVTKMLLDGSVPPPGHAPACQPACSSYAHRSVDRRASLSYQEFAEHYRHKQPVIISGLAHDWAAVSRWHDVAHLRTLLDDEVLVLRSPDGHHFLKRDCDHFSGAFARVADTLFGAPLHGPAERLYARAPLSGGLRDEICLDKLGELASGAAGMQSFTEAKCGVWLGSGGCITPLHYDLCHGFLVGVLGTKRFTYFAPEDFRALDSRPDELETSSALAKNLENAARLSADIDGWRSDQDRGAEGMAGVAAGMAATGARESEMPATDAREPNFHVARQRAQAAAWHAIVKPGDVLYTPPYWWHHVETGADEAALSVLVPWDPTPEEPVHSAHLR